MTGGLFDPVSVAPVGATLGEGPTWVERDAALWFVDIKQQRVYRFDPESGALSGFDAPAQVGWLIPAEGGGFIAGLQTGLHRFDPSVGRFELLMEVEPDKPTNRLNDACSDPKGRIWFGSMDNGESAVTGRYYCFDRGRLVSAERDPVAITNGPAVSPDGKLLYHTDTVGGFIYVCDMGDDGTLGPSREFARLAPEEGHPDGPTVDAEGCVWSGVYGGWEARRYSPSGELLQRVKFPVSNITKVAFGGGDLRTVYVTTARHGLKDFSDQPEAGNLFAFKSDVPGFVVPPVPLSA